MLHSVDRPTKDAGGVVGFAGAVAAEAEDAVAVEAGGATRLAVDSRRTGTVAAAVGAAGAADSAGAAVYQCDMGDNRSSFVGRRARCSKGRNRRAEGRQDLLRRVNRSTLYASPCVG